VAALRAVAARARHPRARALTLYARSAHSAAMHLMFYTDDKGNKVYTLKVRALSAASR
jgi:hypothetical protein